MTRSQTWIVAAACLSLPHAFIANAAPAAHAPTAAAKSQCHRLPLRKNGDDTSITPRAPQPADTWGNLGRQFEHVVVIVLENQDYATVMHKPAMRKLARQGTLFTHFAANFHPSYSNYLALIGGRYFGARGDTDIGIPAREKTVADLLEAKGLTWKQYAEAFPGNCSTVAFSGREPYSSNSLYARKHVPFMSFESVTGNPQRCSNVVNASAFDPRHLPNYAFYSPDMCHDGHDICASNAASALKDAGTRLDLAGDAVAEKLIGRSDAEADKKEIDRRRLDQAAAWLVPLLKRIRADRQAMKGTLIIVTFDESATLSNNHIFTLFLGPMVKQGYRENGCYDDFNVLRTIEDNFDIGTLGAEDEKSAPIVHVWKGH
ncbi:MAG TPA: alkaline phosphatase family protein [Burkholderiales bacterium]|nr:alkaline phosphatase family protein [Burkholderiales bacterium]